MVDIDRIITLESKLAHQEHTIAQLDTVICQQQAQIALLEKRCEQLNKRISELYHGMTNLPSAEKPPHY